MDAFGSVDTDSPSFAPRMEVVRMVLKGFRYGKRVGMGCYNADVIGKHRHDSVIRKKSLLLVMEHFAPIKQEILDIGEVYEEVEPIKLEKASNVKQETLDIKEVYDEVEHAAPIKLDEAVFKQEILAIGEVHDQVEHVDPIKLEEGATIKQEILDIREIYDDHAPIKDEHCSDDDTGFRGDQDAYSKTISVAYTGVFVCHHCGFEADCVDDMRRHMRRHRGLSVGDQVSRVEEVRRDTSMCRGLGEATKFSNLKMSKMATGCDDRCGKLLRRLEERAVPSRRVMQLLLMRGAVASFLVPGGGEEEGFHLRDAVQVRC
ncbi:hypothetical protein AAG570_007442 [Ranatra chinensis]|uniref:G-patch domain-containing protein n=1 Tax=Ranatra chinensis TaxID=642074 RepID=A0ABD0XVV9_9HEMI